MSLRHLAGRQFGHSKKRALQGANAISKALQRVEVLSEENRRALLSIAAAVREAFLRQLGDPKVQWSNLADVLNVAEALAGLGICSDEASVAAIESGHEVLSRVYLTAAQGGSWTLTAAEIARLDAALEIHRLQLRFCTTGEYDKATFNVREKARQYRNGNAPKGVQVLAGV